MHTKLNFLLIGFLGLMLTACSKGSSGEKAPLDRWPEMKAESIESYQEIENCEQTVEGEFLADDGNMYSFRSSSTQRTERKIEKFANNVERHDVQTIMSITRCSSLDPCFDYKYEERGTDFQRTISLGSNIYRLVSEESLVSTLIQTNDSTESERLNKPESSKTTYSSLYRLEGNTKHLLETTVDGVQTRVDGALTETRSGEPGSKSYHTSTRLVRPFEIPEGRMLRWDSTCTVQKL
ncbi:MAG: hypothetical protein ACK5Y2_05495 [Bdellovibrionales bacterium]